MSRNSRQFDQTLIIYEGDGPRLSDRVKGLKDSLSGLFPPAMWELASKRFSSEHRLWPHYGLQENAFVSTWAWILRGSKSFYTPIQTAWSKINEVSNIKCPSIHRSLHVIKHRYWRVNKGLTLLCVINWLAPLLLIVLCLFNSPTQQWRFHYWCKKLT